MINRLFIMCLIFLYFLLASAFCYVPSFYSIDTGSILCPVGHYKLIGNEDTQFIDCEAGKFTPNVYSESCQACGPGKTSNSDSSGCIECQPGTYNPYQVGDCIPCPADTYNPDPGATYCKSCFSEFTYPPKFENVPNGNSCTICPSGTYNDKRGMSKKDACNSCPIGYVLEVGTENQCPQCKKGSYNDDVGQATCKLCPAGTYNPEEGSGASSDCYQCEQEKYSEAGSAECLYNDQQHQASCTRCPVGTYNNLEGQESCEKCPKGTPLINIGTYSVDGRSGLCVLDCYALDNYYREGYECKCICFA